MLNVSERRVNTANKVRLCITLGISLAEQPDLAQDFANLASRNGNGGATILPLRFQANNVGAIELLGDALNLDMAGAISEAWDDNHDAIRFNNYTTPGGLRFYQVFFFRCRITFLRARIITYCARYC